jgi:O-methyltransferase involved in polyketide biosynthesis
MTEIANVSGTAFIIAEFRAAENQQLQPLYLDDIVELFLNEQTHQAAGEVLQVFPPAKDAVANRCSINN